MIYDDDVDGDVSFLLDFFSFLLDFQLLSLFSLFHLKMKKLISFRELGVQCDLLCQI